MERILKYFGRVLSILMVAAVIAILGGSIFQEIANGNGLSIISYIVGTLLAGCVALAIAIFVEWSWKEN